MVYKKKADYEGALENHNRALKIRLKIFGEKHPETALAETKQEMIKEGLPQYFSLKQKCNSKWIPAFARMTAFLISFFLK